MIMTLQNMTEQKMMMLMEVLKQNPYVTYVTESVGCGDLEFEIDVRDSNELHDNMNLIRRKAKDLIKNYEICMTYSEEQINYLPGSEHRIKNLNPKTDKDS